VLKAPTQEHKGLKVMWAQYHPQVLKVLRELKEPKVMLELEERKGM
jgi:hypothetical protein